MGSAVMGRVCAHGGVELRATRHGRKIKMDTRVH